MLILLKGEAQDENQTSFFSHLGLAQAKGQLFNV
jgi:hypothetical protein